MPKLILLRGNSGSGKSAAALSLQERFGPYTLLLNHDTMRLEMLMGKDAGAVPLYIHLLRYGFEHSEITILEGILDSEACRPLFEKAVEWYGLDNIYAYYYDIPFEETLRRHATKTVFRYGEFGPEDLKRWWRKKDLLDLIPETMLGPELSLEDAVDLIERRVRAEMEP